MTLDPTMVHRKLARLGEVEAGVARRSPAEEHGYQLRPPVDEPTLVRAEQAIGAPLPDGYRQFLTAAGDGGAGPYWGVLPLGEALERLEWQSGDLEPLGRDSPLAADVDFGELVGRPDDWDEHQARLRSDPGYVAAYDRLTTTYSLPPWVNGRLPIADIGCGDWLFLVVRGARRGTVWVDSVEGGTGLYCLEVDFPEFYRRWLDAALAHATGERERPYARYSFLEYGNNPRYRPV